MSAKITLEEVKRRISEKWDYINVIDESFVSIKKICRFLDKDFGEFSSTCQNLITGRSRPGHPERFKEIVSAVCAQAGAKAQEQRLDRLGMTRKESSDTRKEKLKQKVLRRRIKIAEIRKANMMEKHGVENYRDSAEYRNHQRHKTLEFNKKNLHSRDKHKFYMADSVLERVKYLINDRPYFEMSDKVQWNRDSARAYLAKYGELAFKEACSNYAGPRSLLEKFCESQIGLIPFQTKLFRYRPDFKISDDIFVNSDGLYWHSEKHLKRTYHFDLRKTFEDEGKRIFQFREDEIYHKTDIVKSILDNASGKVIKIYARNSKICFPKNWKQFLETNHLMGAAQGSSVIGLERENEIVSLMTYRFRNGILKIERFCSKIGHVVIGALSKILAELKRQLDVKEIHSWVDLRYGDGKSLYKMGFSHKKMF